LAILEHGGSLPAAQPLISVIVSTAATPVAVWAARSAASALASPACRNTSGQYGPARACRPHCLCSHQYCHAERRALLPQVCPVQLGAILYELVDSLHMAFEGSEMQGCVQRLVAGVEIGSAEVERRENRRKLRPPACVVAFAAPCQQQTRTRQDMPGAGQSQRQKPYRKSPQSAWACGMRSHGRPCERRAAAEARRTVAAP